MIAASSAPLLESPLLYSILQDDENQFTELQGNMNGSGDR